MNETIVAYTGNDNYLACSYSGFFSGISYKLNDSPIVYMDGKLIIGVLNNHNLTSYLRENPLDIPTELSYGNILRSLNRLNFDEKYKGTELLIITITGDIFLFQDSILFHIKHPYISIGPGKDIVYGCLYGLSTMKIPDDNKIEVAMGALRESDPSRNSVFKIERI